MADDAWKAKVVEDYSRHFVSEIARSTGVDAAEVEKVLGHLGLQNALAHKLEFPNGVRITASQVHQ
ncbi:MULTISPECIES: hypothetical protein [unclassified Phenylobacterium]|uniref:hypothetical protein n=1 Tax=unclassified Phenylobacterium TaxID=2640670 RepID=UPI00083B5C45|nr:MULTISPECIES: hypothetical protein [unclassified Phenylobacterium]